MKKIYLFIIWLPILFLFSCKSDIPEKNSLFPVTTGDLYQFIDREGKIVINPQFGEASCFRDGIALVGTSGDEPKYGFINEAGEYIIQPKYISATIFSEGICFVVEEDSPPIALDEEGSEIFRLKDVKCVSIFEEGFAAFSAFNAKGEELWGFINKSGEKVIPAQFSKVGSFGNGLFNVENKDSKWGYIDESGNLIISYQFDGVSRFFKSNIAIVRMGEKYGLINKEGEYIVNPQFEFIKIDGDKIIIKMDGKYGWADNNGQLIINPQFDNVMLFKNNELAPVKLGDKWGYIDEKGLLKVNPQFSLAYSFDGDIAVVFLNEKLGFINDEGKYIVNPQFDGISSDYNLKNQNTTTYEIVETDYFNVEPIVEKISNDFTTYDVNGINSNTTANEILTRYNLKQNDFSKNSYDVTIEKNIILRKGAKLTVKVYFLNTPWIKEKTSYWNYNYYFDGSTTVGYVLYRILLSDKGYGKNDLLIEEVSKLFKNYQKVDNVPNKNQTIFRYTSGDVYLVNQSSSEVMVYKDFTVKEE